MGESMARVQDDISNRGMRRGASRSARLMGKVARRMGDYEYRLARANKEAAERENLLSSTGRDGLRYAGAGWILRAGERAPDSLSRLGLDDEALAGTVADHDRYIDGKGREIHGDYYKEGKRRHGSSHCIHL